MNFSVVIDTLKYSRVVHRILTMCYIGVENGNKKMRGVGGAYGRNRY
jgi:hypothetical protein